MISDVLPWIMTSLSVVIFWLIIAFVALLAIALVVYVIGYYWTLGQHRALLEAFRDRQKNQPEVTKHGTQKQ